jgi:hypothetical protein
MWMKILVDGVFNPPDLWRDRARILAACVRFVLGGRPNQKLYVQILESVDVPLHGLLDNLIDHAIERVAQDMHLPK